MPGWRNRHTQHFAPFVMLSSCQRVQQSIQSRAERSAHSPITSFAEEINEDYTALRATTAKPMALAPKELLRASRHRSPQLLPKKATPHARTALLPLARIHHFLSLAGNTTRTTRPAHTHPPMVQVVFHPTSPLAFSTSGERRSPTGEERGGTWLRSGERKRHASHEVEQAACATPTEVH